MEAAGNGAGASAGDAGDAEEIRKDGTLDAAADAGPSSGSVESGAECQSGRLLPERRSLRKLPDWDLHKQGWGLHSRRMMDNHWPDAVQRHRR